MAAQSEAIELGRWLARERGKRTYQGKPLSGPVLARFFNTWVQATKIPVKGIAQQEVSKLETATPDTAPKRQQPWWGALRQFIEDGYLDELIAAGETPVTAADSQVIVPHEMFLAKADALVRTPDGEVVGRVVWRAK